MLDHACRLSLEGFVSKRRDGRYPSGRSARPGSSRSAATARSSSSPATSPRPCDKDAVGSLGPRRLPGGQSRPCRPRRHRLSAARCPATFAPASRRCSARRPLRRQTLGRRRAAASPGSAPSWSPRSSSAPGPRDGLLRHAAFRGLREDKPAPAVIRETEPSPATAARAAGTPHPSRPRLLARGRRHQAGPRRLLRRGLAADGATSGQPPAGAPALPGRHRRPVLLPEARLEGPEPGDRHLRRPDRTTATSRSSPSTACPGSSGSSRAARWRSTGWQSTLDDLEHPDQIVMDLDPGEGVRLDRRSSPPPARSATASRQPASPPSSRPPAARASTSSLRSVRRPGGTRSRASPRRMAKAMARDAPDRYVATITKAKRDGQDPDRLPAQRPQQHRRRRPTAPAPGPARRCRCRSTGTSSAQRSARRISPSPTLRRESPTSRIHGRISGCRPRRWKRRKAEGPLRPMCLCARFPAWYHN